MSDHMTLAEFFNQEGQISMRAFAKSIGAPTSNLSDWTSGKRPVPVEWCVTIEQATSGLVSRKTLYQGDWRRVWPELA